MCNLRNSAAIFLFLICSSSYADRVIVVDQGGAGDFLTVQSAINSITDSRPGNIVTVEIHGGTYNEQVRLVRPSIILKGADPANTKISWNSSGSGVAYRGTLRVTASDVLIRDLTLENTVSATTYPAPTLTTEDQSPKNVTFNNVRFLSAGKDPLWMSGNGVYTFRNCLIRGKYDVLTLYGGTYSFGNCRSEVLQGGQAHLWLSNAAKLTFFDSHFEGVNLNNAYTNCASSGSLLTLRRCTAFNNDLSFPYMTHYASVHGLSVYITADVPYSSAGHPETVITIIPNLASALNWSRFK